MGRGRTCYNRGNPYFLHIFVRGEENGRADEEEFEILECLPRDVSERMNASLTREVTESEI